MRDPNTFAVIAQICICSDCVAKFAERLAQESPEAPSDTVVDGTDRLAVPGRPIRSLVAEDLSAGKSMVLKVASGLLAPRSGRILLDDRDVTGQGPQQLLASGLAHVLQGHSVFREMTVAENVLLGGYTLKDRRLRPGPRQGARLGAGAGAARRPAAERAVPRGTARRASHLTEAVAHDGDAYVERRTAPTSPRRCVRQRRWMSTAGALGFAAWPCLQPIAGANSRTDRLAAALAVRSSVNGSTCW